MCNPRTWMSMRSPSSLLHLISQTTPRGYNKQQIVLGLSFHLLRSGNGRLGACAYSEDAMKNETLVNESVIFCPLFNVKICDILYLKCCISYECFTAAFHVHIQQSAGFGKWEAVCEWACHVCVTALQQSRQDITRFQSQYVELLQARSVLAKRQPHLHLPLLVLFYIFF